VKDQNEIQTIGGDVFVHHDESVIYNRDSCRFQFQTTILATSSSYNSTDDEEQEDG
jgi:hypothetical protein